MRERDLWRSILGLDQTVIEGVYLDDDQGAVVLRVRPHSRFGRQRCGICHQRCPGFDHGGGLRRWRTLDLGEMMCLLEGETPRACCPEHGVVVAAVPWARHRAGHTYAFDDQVAWLATHCSKQDGPVCGVHGQEQRYPQ